MPSEAIMRAKGFRNIYHHGVHWIPSAKRRLDWARRHLIESEYPDLDWEDGYAHPELAFAEFEYGHFTVRVSLEYEECPDNSWIGEFGRDWKPGAIDIRLADGGTYHGRFGGWSVDANYFYPGSFGPSEASACRVNRNLDWRLMKKLLRDEAFPVDLHVKVSKGGHTLGDSWLGGGLLVDGEPAGHVFGEEIDQHIDEAIEEATSELESLCPMA